MKKQGIIRLIATFLVAVMTLLAFASCELVQGAPGKDGVTPTIEISEDGYWVINGTKTEVKAAGTDGADGKDGKDGNDGIDGIDGEDGIDGDDGAPGENGIDGETPTIEISDDGYWVINGTKTEYKAIGVDGTPGIDGVDGKPGEDGIDGTTPTIDISEDGYWIINGVKTDKKAIGVDGENGENGSNGVTPTIDISEDGYWIINGVKTDKKAIGVDGENGENGSNGVTPTIDISEDGYWVINGVKTEYVAGNNCKHRYIDLSIIGVPCIVHKVVKMCDECGELVAVDENPIEDHVYEENRGDFLYCKMCGEKGPANYFRDGDYIYYGEYPQTIKADDVTITDTQDSRGYYLGSDGFYYAAVTATPYGSNYTFSTGASVTKNEVYYFKVEPIRWRILSIEGETALIYCDSILANMKYQDNYYREVNNIGSTLYYVEGVLEGYNKVFANNYYYSSVKKWLNGEFGQNSFTEFQRELISDSNIFILKQSEVMNNGYGFYDSTDRQMQTSDYSRATGAYMSTSTDFYGNGYWYLYHSGEAHGDEVNCVKYDGTIVETTIAYKEYGVVPAMWINLTINP